MAVPAPLSEMEVPDHPGVERLRSTLRRQVRVFQPSKTEAGRFHSRWQSAPSSDPQIRIQDTPAIGNVNQLKVSGLPVGSREPSGGMVEELTGALDAEKAHNHSRRSQ
jgi:hypothetical protein